MPDVSVVIPVRDGGALFADVLAALSRQTVAHELIVCDSGSRDGSARLAREHGARLIEIAPERFSHGGTRNLLLAACAGAHVALLTQDAVPAGEGWLQELLDGFALADEVALVYGPYRPCADASTAVAIELDSWFRSLSPDGTPRVERLDEEERSALPASELIGRRGFFNRRQRLHRARGVGAGTVPRGPLRRGPSARDRHAACRLCQGVRAASRRDPLARLPRPRSSCGAALTSGAGCARSTAGASPRRRGTC